MGDKGGLRLGDSVVERDAGAFIEDLDAQDLRSAHGPVLVGAGEGDVEGQHLVAVAGQFQKIDIFASSSRA